MSASVIAHHSAGSMTGVELLPILALLGSAIIAVPLSKSIGLGTVLGYLIAGFIMGPFGMGVIADANAILHIAELGVVMFLFVIGLEMRPSRLWSMRGEIFGLGFAQVGICSIFLTGFGQALGYSFAQSFVGGTGFVLTSTAIVMQILEERHVRGLPRGRRTIAILLLEDLAIVPLLAMVALLAPVKSEEGGAGGQILNIVIPMLSILMLVLCGKYLLNPFFKVLGAVRARELMTAAALLVVLGSAYVMQIGGLSMAMGAFVAGVLLSESAFRHQLEADIEPFRGILLGLFFLGVGMSLNVTVITESWKIIVVLVTGYILLKMSVIYIVARLFKLEHREAIGRSVLMAQGGEFAFVLFSAATSNGIITSAMNAIFTSAVIASMALTPLLILLFDILVPKAPLPERDVVAENLLSEVLLIGFGRFGQIVSQPLLARGLSVSIIDISTSIIFDLEPFGFKVYYGDGSRLDVLHAAGAREAKLIIIAIDDRATCLKAVDIIKNEFPQAKVLVRAYDREHAIELSHLGVDWQVRETFESALSLGDKALEMLDLRSEVRRQIMDEIRVSDKQRFAIETREGIHATHDLVWNNSDTGQRQQSNSSTLRKLSSE